MAEKRKLDSAIVPARARRAACSCLQPRPHGPDQYASKLTNI
jgi:hypothetical protein